MPDVLDQLRTYGDALERAVEPVTLDEARDASARPSLTAVVPRDPSRRAADANQRGARRAVGARSVWYAAAAAVLVFALAASVGLSRRNEVTQSVASTTPAPTVARPDDGALVAAGLDGRSFTSIDVQENGAPRALVDGRPLRIAFKGERVSFGSCNTFSGNYKVHEGKLIARADIATAIACGGVNGEQDAWLTAVMTAQPSISIEASNLRLSTAATVITFAEAKADAPDVSPSPSPPTSDVAVPPTTPAPTAPSTTAPTPTTTPPATPTTTTPSPDDSTRAALAGRTFTTITVTQDGAAKTLVTEPGASTALRLSFMGDGVRADGACTTTSWQRADLHDGRLSVSGATTSQSTCSLGIGLDPGPLLDQDTWFRSFVESAPAVSFDGVRLTLSSGGTVAVLA